MSMRNKFVRALMRSLFAILAFLLCLPLLMAEDGSLYVPKEGGKATETVKDGFYELRFPVVKIPVTHAVLRYDTEDRAILWLELHLTEMRDSGDSYYFEPANNSKYQFYTRTSHFNPGCSKWALRFDKLQKARKILGEVKKAYKLSDKCSIDKTAATKKK